MAEPISLVLAWLGSYFVTQAWDGILGNEAHRLTHIAVRKVLETIDGDAAERVNHDIVRTVRLAQLAALERVLDGYARANGAAWDRGGIDRPAAFLDAAAKFRRDQRGRAKTDPASLILQVTETLTATIDGLLDRSQPATLAGARAMAIAEFAEDEVLAELGRGIHDIAIPDDFAAHLRKGAGAAFPGFLDEFTDDIRDAVKSNPRFRDILLVSGIAEIKARGFEINVILLRIETQLGVDRGKLQEAVDRWLDIAIRIKGDTEELRARSLQVDSAGAGPAVGVRGLEAGCAST